MGEDKILRVITVGNAPSVKGGITSVISQILSHNWNEQKIEVKQYLPIEDKLDLVTKIINDSIDTILVSLSGLLDRKALTEEQILSNSDLILALNLDKYKTPDDLIARLGWIKSMNMTHPQMHMQGSPPLVHSLLPLSLSDMPLLYPGNQNAS